MGLATVWSENGQNIEEINYIDGKQDGLATTLHENGQKNSESISKDGKHNIKPQVKQTTVLEHRNDIAYLPNENEPFTGVYIEHYSNGHNSIEINYKDGRKNGLSTGWDENGKKHVQINFIDDKQNGLATVWYENGQKMSEMNYIDGKQNGLTTVWHENGQKLGESSYVDDEEKALKLNYNVQIPNDHIQEIISRCRTQMGEYGAAMVKACVDQDIEAEDALRKY